MKKNMGRTAAIFAQNARNELEALRVPVGGLRQMVWCPVMDANALRIMKNARISLNRAIELAEQE